MRKSGNGKWGREGEGVTMGKEDGVLPLGGDIVTPNRLYTSLPAPMYIICTLFV